MAQQTRALNANNSPKVPRRRLHARDRARTLVCPRIRANNSLPVAQLNPHIADRVARHCPLPRHNNNLAAAVAHHRLHLLAAEQHARNIARSRKQRTPSNRHNRAPLPKRRRHRINNAVRPRPHKPHRHARVARHNNVAAAVPSKRPHNNTRVARAQHKRINTGKRHAARARPAAQQRLALNHYLRSFLPSKRHNRRNLALGNVRPRRRARLNNRPRVRRHNHSPGAVRAKVARTRNHQPAPAVVHNVRRVPGQRHLLDPCSAPAQVAADDGHDRAPASRPRQHLADAARHTVHKPVGLEDLGPRVGRQHNVARRANLRPAPGPCHDRRRVLTHNLCLAPAERHVHNRIAAAAKPLAANRHKRPILPKPGRHARHNAPRRKREPGHERRRRPGVCLKHNIACLF